MSPLLADIVGLLGGAIMIVAYGYSNMAARMDFVLFNLLNLVGAVLLIASLMVHFNLASMVLEIVWAGIALIGLIRAWTQRSAA